MSKRFHFQIPKDNIRVEKFEKSGFSEPYQRLNHSDHGRKLLSQTLTLQQVEFTKKDARFTEELFLQIETPPELSLKTEKLKIEKLGFEIINYSNQNKSIGTAKINKSELETFKTKVIEYTESEDHRRKTYFSSIEDISTIPTESKIKTEIDFESDEEISVIINLYSSLSRKEKMVINNYILDELKKITKDSQIRNFSNGVTSIACKLKSKEIPNIAAEFSTIKEIKNNSVSYISQSMPTESMPNSLTVNEPESDSIVCIIDSGVSDANGIFTSIVSERVPYLPTGSVEPDNNHGTFVASRCVFGDEIDACLGSHLLTPYCKLIDVSVFGLDAIGKPVNPDDFHLRTVIEDVIIRFKDRVKVYNLSLGTNVPINDGEFSDLAKLLDYLSKEHKVLFIVSSGNILKLLGDFPSNHFGHANSRLGSPAESILSITVGSVAKYENSVSLSEIGEVSPFSRIGPGADKGIKPELVAHGGNMIKPYSYAPRVSTIGISRDGKTLAVDVGTSHSAPIISQYAQRLFDFYPESDPNLVKALLYHFAEKRKVHEEIVSDPNNFVGFGEPKIENALEAGNFNAAYIYEGQLDDYNYQYVSFHVPDSLAEDNKEAQLKIKITITYDPPVNPDNDTEYSQTRISAQLIKPTEVGMRPISVSGDDKVLLPWNPAIQFEKSFTRSYFTGKWELKLRLYCRGKLPNNYLQDYAVVIEIIDENNSTDTYSNIKNQFSSIYTTIKIRTAA